MNKQLIELNAIKDINGIWFDVAAEVASYDLKKETYEIYNLTLTNSYNPEEVIQVEDLAHMPDRFSQMVVNGIEEEVMQAEVENHQEYLESLRIENQME